MPELAALEAKEEEAPAAEAASVSRDIFGGSFGDIAAGMEPVAAPPGPEEEVPAPTAVPAAAEAAPPLDMDGSWAGADLMDLLPSSAPEAPAAAEPPAAAEAPAAEEAQAVEEAAATEAPAVAEVPAAAEVAEAPAATEAAAAAEEVPPAEEPAAAVAAPEAEVSKEEEAPPAKPKDADAGWGDFDFDDFEDSAPKQEASAGAAAASDSLPEAAAAASAPEPAVASKEPAASNGESTSSWVLLTGDAQADTPDSGKAASSPLRAGAELASKIEEEGTAAAASTPFEEAAPESSAPEATTTEAEAPKEEEPKAEEPEAKEAEDAWGIAGLEVETREAEAAPEEASSSRDICIPSQEEDQVPQPPAPTPTALDELFGAPAANGPPAEAQVMEALAAVMANGAGEAETSAADAPAGGAEASTPASPAAAPDLLEAWFSDAPAAPVPAAPTPATPATEEAAAPAAEPPAAAGRAAEEEEGRQLLEAELAELRRRAAELERQLEEVKRCAASREEELQAAQSLEVAQRERAEADLVETKRQLEAERERSGAEREAAAEAAGAAAAAAAPRSGEGDEEFNLPDFLWSCNSEVMAYVQKIVGENARLRQQVANASPVAEAPAGEETAPSQAPAGSAAPFDPSGASPEIASAFAEGVGQEDGHQIAPLLALLTDHAANLKVCSQVCSALEILTFTLAENRQAIIQKGGVKVIIEMIERHQGAEASLLRPGMDALWNLTFEDEAVEAATEAGGIERIAALMRKHEGEAELLGAACAVLLNLAVREPNRWKIVESGGVALVAAAMQQHSQNEEVLELGCQALYMLAYHQDLKPLVLAAKGGDAAALAASCPRGGGRAQKWGRWLQEVLAC